MGQVLHGSLAPDGFAVDAVSVDGRACPNPVAITSAFRALPRLRSTKSGVKPVFSAARGLATLWSACRPNSPCARVLV